MVAGAALSSPAISSSMRNGARRLPDQSSMQTRAALAASFLAVVLMSGTLLSAARAQPAPKPDPARDAQALYGEVWEWSLREFPEIATLVGDPRYRDRLADQSAAAVERRLPERE